MSALPQLQPDVRHVTDPQWLTLIALVTGIDEQWVISYPPADGESVRVVGPDGTAIVVRADGSLLTADDLPGA